MITVKGRQIDYQAPNPADSIDIVTVDGYELVAYTYGTGDNVILGLNGGPGLPCDYLREPHYFLKDNGYRFVIFDQLGCGQSDRPEDKALWSISRYVEEVETVRTSLGLGKVHLMGHSWGGWLAIEYALTYESNLKSLILENTCADMPHLVSELNRLKAALGSQTVAMMQHHEAMGSLDHPEYEAAITLLNYRHVCRKKNWDPSLNRSLDDWNMNVYGTMQGPNEFLYTGNLKDWNRVEEMKAIKVPAFISVGQHDELTPACAHKMHLSLENSTINVFPNSAHMPFYDEPDSYQEVLLAFLSKILETS